MKRCNLYAEDVASIHGHDIRVHNLGGTAVSALQAVAMPGCELIFENIELPPSAVCAFKLPECPNSECFTSVILSCSRNGESCIWEQTLLPKSAHVMTADTESSE